MKPMIIESILVGAKRDSELAIVMGRQCGLTLAYKQKRIPWQFLDLEDIAEGWEFSLSDIDDGTKAALIAIGKDHLGNQAASDNDALCAAGMSLYELFEVFQEFWISKIDSIAESICKTGMLGQTNAA